jgi:hypothetical protein
MLQALTDAGSEALLQSRSRSSEYRQPLRELSDQFFISRDLILYKNAPFKQDECATGRNDRLLGLFVYKEADTFHRCSP